MKKPYEFVCMSYENASVDAGLLSEYLNPRELEKIDNAVSKRKLEFLYGRLCAKYAYALVIGSDAYNSHLCILSDSLGAPFFEDGSLSVGITHDEGLAAAVVTDKERLRAGIDLQKISSKGIKVVSRWDKSFFDAHSTQYGVDFLATAIWVAKEAMSKLLGYGLSVFDALELSEIVQRESLMVNFKNFHGFAVIIRPYRDYLFGFAAQNRDIENFCEKQLVIKETPLELIISKKVINRNS